jgi:UDP-N-acetylglucosamine 2-epimerase (non-hydrolysing)
MKIAVILGTRPEIIKLSPIIRMLEDHNADFFLLHTGQHYSTEMDSIFFEDLKLAFPKYNLGIGSGSPGKQLGSMIAQIEEVFLSEQPDQALVLGDTISSLAGALSAKMLRIKVNHAEAGERCYDREMPEEINRTLIDHISDYLFVANAHKPGNLIKEGISSDRIYITGNTLVDALQWEVENNEIKSSEVLKKYKLEPHRYFLATAHRQESVDVPDRLQGILRGLQLISERFKLPVIFPVHPRTQKNIKMMRLVVPDGIRCIEPLGFSEFTVLEQKADLILSDSGGVKMEAYILHVPHVTLRETTELPELLNAGANILAGYDPERILICAQQMLDSNPEWGTIFGDGHAAEKIVRVLTGQ